MTRSASVLWCLAAGLCLAARAAGQEPTSDLAEVQAVAESIVAREEATSDRPFDAAFRTKAKTLLAALPLAELVSQTGDHGLGLNALGDTQADLVYTPLTPCRIVDTRLAGGAIAAGTMRSFLVTGTNYSAQGGSATGCGVPNGPTTAAVINFVAVDPTGPGNLQVTPHGSPLPTASIINYRAGVTLANGLVVAVCNPSSATCSSDITIKANVSATGLVADVQGYFQRVTTGGVGTALLADSAVTAVKMADGAVTAAKIADGAVTAPKIASGAVVRSLNSLTEAVTLGAGSNVSITPSGNTLTISASVGPGVGDITAVYPGPGLTGGGETGDVTLSTDFAGPGVAAKVARSDHTHEVGVGNDNTAIGNSALSANTAGNQNTATGSRALSANSTGSYNTATGNAALYENTTGDGNTALGNGALRWNTAGFINTATGNVALYQNTSGVANTATGNGALSANTTGSMNTAIGASTLSANTTASYNTAIGYSALGSNTTGEGNTATGLSALSTNTTGFSNTATGSSALLANTTGYHNTATGSGALDANTTGNANTATGSEALATNTTGIFNTASGFQALAANTTACCNSAFGFGALSANTEGPNNSALGFQALAANTTGGQNVAFGMQALFTNTTGQYNAAFGQYALFVSEAGSNNTALGFQALQGMTTGSNNVAVGYFAGGALGSGSNNIYVGGAGAASESGAIHIGEVGTHTATYIAGISGATSASGVAVYVGSSGQLGTTTSSRRYKEQIADMEAESDVLLKLRPVSFYYRPELDEAHLRQYGLVAEEVAEVAPQLVAYDQDGTPQSVRYHFVNAMLLSEVQKQRRLVEDEKTTIEKQQSRIQDLEARLAKLEAALAGDR